MSKRRDRYEYMHGDGVSKYGIWNAVRKQFQFGISEDSPMLAEARLVYKIGDDAKKYRFSAKALPREGE